VRAYSAPRPIAVIRGLVLRHDGTEGEKGWEERTIGGEIASTTMGDKRPWSDATEKVRIRLPNSDF